MRFRRRKKKMPLSPKQIETDLAVIQVLIENQPDAKWAAVLIHDYMTLTHDVRTPHD
jgi:hypothetical protein